MNHDAIDNIITRNGAIPRGVGITPNPYAEQQAEWVRRQKTAKARHIITGKIQSLFEPRYITPPETSELIEAIVTCSDARKVLELGTYSGFTALHILRAIIGKDGAKLVSIDGRSGFYDAEWWEQWKPTLEFVEGWTPTILSDNRIATHAPYDLVFVDSDHSVEVTQAELNALWPITKPGTLFLFHDLPEWQSPTNRTTSEVRSMLLKRSDLAGAILPTCEQLDCLDVWGQGYPKQCNPHLGIFIRQ